MHLRRSIFAAALLILAAAGAPRAATHLITVQDNHLFTPSNLTIQQGDFVQWKNNGASFIHSTTSGLSSSDPNVGVLWDQSLPPGASFTRQFQNAGTFDFFCRPHELMGMKGQIVVAHSVPASDIWGKTGLIVLIVLLGGIAIWRRRVSACRP